MLIDAAGLERLVGPPRTIAEEIRRAAAALGERVHVAVAATRMAALVLAQARPGLTVVEPGREAETLAPLPIGILEKVGALRRSVLDPPERDGASASGAGGALRHSVLDTPERDGARVSGAGVGPRASNRKSGAPRELEDAIAVFRRWGLRTLGELAGLPPGDLASRLGQRALVWQAVARGEDVHPLVPTLPEERFASSIDLEWPIEGLEPLSFVLTRLLEPLSLRLERRDRGVAVLHIELGLVTRTLYTRHLQLPSPMRDVRTLRTLALLDLDAHPPPAAIDRVAIVIDPTPGRVLQHALFSRAQPAPDRLSTLLARLGALMGQDRIGQPVPVDSYRPGAFAMLPFPTEPPTSLMAMARGAPPPRAEDLALERRLSRSGEGRLSGSQQIPAALQFLQSALRRCRPPVPARVTVVSGRPVRVTTDRRGFAGGAVVGCAGPWRTSGEWWSGGAGRSGELDGLGGEEPLRRPVLDTRAHNGASASGAGVGPRAFNRDEWDVALNDGAAYRIFVDRETNGWFIDAIVD